jgi:hypothetical protein
MRAEEFPIFTLEQANMLVPRMTELTAETIQEVEHVKARKKTGSMLNSADVVENLETEIAGILHRWSQRAAEIGVYPKGYFTCDFRSPDPSSYFCWKYGEHEITHTHKVWESFKDRKPIDDQRLNGIMMSLN